MHSTSAPSEVTAPVWYYDGRSALRQQALLVAEGECFRLEGAENSGRYRLADLEPRAQIGGEAVYGLKGQPGWRIGFIGDVSATLAQLLPREWRYGRLIDRFGLWRSAAVFAVLAMLIVFLILQSPRAVARMLPGSVEQHLGDAMVGNLGGHFCNGPGGQAALDQLVAELDPGEPVDVHVANFPIVNAATLPGGHIVVFEKLLDDARSPDEVAGVIGHEIGHVHNRDVMESLIRQVGLSVLLGGMEGHVGGYTNALLSMSYSRTAEARADGYAIAMLSRANISPLPTARFFQRMAKLDGDGKAARVVTYMSSHPCRRRANSASLRRLEAEPPIGRLCPQQWARLRAICSSDPNVEGFHFEF